MHVNFLTIIVYAMFLRWDPDNESVLFVTKGAIQLHPWNQKNGDYYRLNAHVPATSRNEVLTPNMMVLGGEATEKY